MKKLKILFTSAVLVFSSCNLDDPISLNSVSFHDDTNIMCTFDLMNVPNNLTTKPEVAIIDWPRWQIGQTVKIKFIDGDVSEHEIVKTYASEWILYANLKFEYVAKNEYADIRIGFNVTRPNGGYGTWSDLGMQSTSAYTNYQNEPSMRLGPVRADESSKRTILHEFGHALGLVHETTNPAANIKWDLPKVYKYYNQWTKDEVNQFVINKASTSNYSKYDPLSIMHYYIPPSLTTDGVGVNERNDLSPTDKNSINKWYPFPIQSIIEPNEKIKSLSWTRIKSPNGRYSITFTTGYLYINDSTNNQRIWSAGKIAYLDASCYLQADGNFVIKGRELGYFVQSIVWTSNTSGFPGAKLYLQDDGDLQLIYNGVVKWSSKNGKV